MKYPKEPSEGAKLEAKNQPNGWVYVIDDSFEGEEEIPPQAIFGAWKVDAKGEIEGDFIPNPNYVNLKENLF